jgi:predicted nucleic acid-binding protein
MRLVVDSNCLLVSIPRLSATRWLYDSIKSGAVEIGFSNEILEQHGEIIGEFYSPSLAGNVIELLINLKDSHWVTPYYRWNLITQDNDDSKFGDCAIACQADHIITHDRHFDVLKATPFPHISVLIMNELKALLFSSI